MVTSNQNSQGVLTVPTWLGGSIDLSGTKAIESSVQAAEKRTAGEIVPLIVQGSTVNASAPILAVLAFGSLVLVLKHGVWLYEHALGDIDALWYGLFALALIGGIAFGRSKTGQMWLTPKWEKRRQVQQRALLAFYEAGLNQTAGRTGILLFVSWRERQAVVLADKGIAQHCAPQTFEAVVAELVRGAKEQRLGDGFVKAVGICGEILAKHIPIAEGDRNELHDTLRIID